MPAVNPELEHFHRQVVQAQHPEDVFGALTGAAAELLEQLSAQYRRMVVKCHPDKFSTASALERHLAEESFKHLSRFKGEAEARIRSGTYGEPYRTTRNSAAAVIKTRSREYRISELLATGTVANLYRGEYDQGRNTEEVATKIAVDRKDNPLILNEQAILKRLSHISLPVIIDSFRTADGQAASVLRYVKGCNFYALRELSSHRDGLMPRMHAGWILERQLSVLGYLHSNMVIHGNIELAHLLVCPENHNVVLVDFCFAIADPSDADYVRIATEGYSSPEVISREPPLPTMDLYALGKSMVYLLGGKVETGELPADLDPRLQSFIDRLTEPDLRHRASDAWQAAHRLVRLREEVFGPHRFVPLPAV